MKALATTVFLFSLTSTALADSCNSAPKPLEGIQGYKSNGLLLAAGSYYELDNCFILSRRQFGSSIEFGFVNNFSKDVASVGMIFIKSQKTFSGASPPDRIKLSRGPGWQLQVPPAKAIGELVASYDRPFRGTIEQRNALYASTVSPDDLLSNVSFREPWHAYADPMKSLSSLDQAAFWQLEPSSLPERYSITNYLVRFAPNKTYSFIPIYVQLQQNVTEVNISISSNVDSLVQQYRIIIK